METREVIVPHDLGRGPVTAVRRMLVHSSLAELMQRGFFERYRALMRAQSLASINELIGPGWMPIALALEHYRACDGIGLSDDETYDAGLRAGEKMGDALLIAGAQRCAPGADSSAWSIFGAYSRMGRRLHDGGSSQYVKLAENTLLIEHRGNPLFSIGYYRTAHGGFMYRTFARVGLELSDFKLSTYRSDGAQIDARLSWK